MTEKRYILSHNGKEDGILDKTNDKGYYGFELARLVNKLSEENKQLKDKLSEYEKENENLNNVLEDFMTITNRLQSEPNNKSLQIMARDMLQMMGKDIMGDAND